MKVTSPKPDKLKKKRKKAVSKVKVRKDKGRRHEYPKNRAKASVVLTEKKKKRLVKRLQEGKKKAKKLRVKNLGIEKKISKVYPIRPEKVLRHLKKYFAPDFEELALEYPNPVEYQAEVQSRVDDVCNVLEDFGFGDSVIWVKKAYRELYPVGKRRKKRKISAKEFELKFNGIEWYYFRESFYKQIKDENVLVNGDIFEFNGTVDEVENYSYIWKKEQNLIDKSISVAHGQMAQFYNRNRKKLGSRVEVILDSISVNQKTNLWHVVFKFDVGENENYLQPSIENISEVKQDLTTSTKSLNELSEQLLIEKEKTLQMQAEAQKEKEKTIQMMIGAGFSKEEIKRYINTGKI